jgi:hypothetical protein
MYPQALQVNENVMRGPTSRDVNGNVQLDLAVDDALFEMAREN